MTDKRLYLALPVLALLAACGEEAADDGRAASGEVLEGTISDAMLPLDRVQSEAPLEDPEAFVAAQSANGVAPAAAGSQESGSEVPDAADDETDEPEAPADSEAGSED